MINNCNINAHKIFCCNIEFKKESKNEIIKIRIIFIIIYIIYLNNTYK